MECVHAKSIAQAHFHRYIRDRLRSGDFDVEVREEE